MSPACSLTLCKLLFYMKFGHEYISIMLLPQMLCLGQQTNILHPALNATIPSQSTEVVNAC